MNKALTLIAIAIGSIVGLAAYTGTTPAPSNQPAAAVGVSPAYLDALQVPILVALPVVGLAGLLVYAALKRGGPLFAVAILFGAVAGIATGQWLLAVSIVLGVSTLIVMMGK